MFEKAKHPGTKTLHALARNTGTEKHPDSLPLHLPGEAGKRHLCFLLWSLLTLFFIRSTSWGVRVSALAKTGTMFTRWWRAFINSMSRGRSLPRNAVKCCVEITNWASPYTQRALKVRLFKTALSVVPTKKHKGCERTGKNLMLGNHFSLRYQICSITSLSIC